MDYMIIGILIGVIIGYLLSVIRYHTNIKKQRHHAIKSSQSVILGHVHEKIAPLLPDFPYHPKDMVFIGKWIDYIIFDGLHTGVCKEIIFLEIKSGTSQLNRNELSIKKTLTEHRVSYKIWRSTTKHHSI